MEITKNNRYTHNLQFFGAVFLLFLTSCSDETVPTTPIASVTDIIVQDNGNNGNASDIEVNFTEPVNTDGNKEYRIIAIKEGQTSGFTLNEANAATPDRYTAVSPAEIFPVQGKTLSANTTDVDGNIISQQSSYRFAVLIVADDSQSASNALAVADQEFQLRTNNLISNHTQELSAGAGSLVRDTKGELVMSDYNIITHLAGTPATEQDWVSKVYQVSSTGSVAELSPPFSLLSGNAFDSKGNLFQSVLLEGKIIKLSPSGDITTLLENTFMLSNPDGIYIDANDNLFVADQQLASVIKITPDGTATVFAQVGNNPRGITGDESGNLYVSHNNSSGEIRKISPTGEVSILANVPTFIPEDYALTYIMWLGYIEYNEGDLYVAGLSTDRIYKVSLQGDVSVFAGSGNRGIPRGGALTANLNRPMGLAFSQDGKHLFISGSTDLVPQHTQASTPARILEIEIFE